MVDIINECRSDRQLMSRGQDCVMVPPGLSVLYVPHYYLPAVRGRDDMVCGCFSCQAHDVQLLRETNRKLQIDIKIMAGQVDMVTNGQSMYILICSHLTFLEYCLRYCYLLLEYLSVPWRK